MRKEIKQIVFVLCLFGLFLSKYELITLRLSVSVPIITLQLMKEIFVYFYVVIMPVEAFFVLINFLIAWCNGGQLFLKKQSKENIFL
jgi:hypothetical protein